MVIWFLNKEANANPTAKLKITVKKIVYKKAGQSTCEKILCNDGKTIVPSPVTFMASPLSQNLSKITIDTAITNTTEINITNK
jgi:hypothetical protein